MLFIADFAFSRGRVAPGAGRQVDRGKGQFYNYIPQNGSIVERLDRFAV